MGITDPQGGQFADSPSEIFDTSGNSAERFLYKATTHNSRREWYQLGAGKSTKID